jgi:hypothetical protein
VCLGKAKIALYGNIDDLSTFNFGILLENLISVQAKASKVVRVITGQ